MGRETRKAGLPAVGKHAKTRHGKMDRMAQADPTVYSTLNAYKQAPTLKHKSYFEIAENADKKAKKLETQVTNDQVPPPGYEFIALGNPELTALCKDMSREQDAMIFIVSESKDQSVYAQTHRLGFHFRERIVDQARQDLLKRGLDKPQKIAISGRPEAIPDDREKMMREADAVLRDLFPRIPNISRMEILRHSFDKANKYFNGKEKVGMAEDLSLARRVQLAALSHIRHTMTRYDELLREGQKWENARKAVEKPCLDIIVKWRGDEETGRDQLDEILREVIEISDDEDSEEDDTSEEEAVAEFSRARPMARLPSTATRSHAVTHGPVPPLEVHVGESPRREPSIISLISPAQPKKLTRRERKAAKQTQQRFKRYAQVAETFRHEPRALRSPATEQMSHELLPSLANPRSGHTEFFQEAGRTVVPSYGAPMYPEVQSYHRAPNGAPRPRGQSPVLVRVAESNGPKVGLTHERQGYNSAPQSPARAQFQDMLVRSIEPLSPGVPRNPERSFSYAYPAGVGDHIAEAPRVLSRKMVEQPLSRAHPDSPSRISGIDGSSQQRRRVLTQTNEQPDLFSEAGFIQVHREPERRVIAHEYDRSRSNIVPVSREPYARIRSPAVYVQEQPRTDSGNVVYRQRTNPIYVHDPASHSHEGIAPRQRNHAVLLNTPGPANRYLGARPREDMRDYEQRLLERPEVSRGAPTQEVHRVSDRRQIIYMDEPDRRLIRVRDHQTEQRSPQPIPVGFRLESRSSAAMPHGTSSRQPSREPHSYGRPIEHPIMHYREVVRPAPLDDHRPTRMTLPTGQTEEDYYNRQKQQDHIVIHQSAFDQAPAQQTFSQPGHPQGPISYY